MPSLLEVEGMWDKKRVKVVSESLLTLWNVVFEEAPGTLDQDLQKLQRWFDPVAQGQRLRKLLADLRTVPADFVDPGPPLTLRAGADRWLITPEGRCAMELFLQLKPPLYYPLRIDEQETLRFDQLLGHLYRKWSRHRLQSVIDLLEGSQKPLQIPAAGVVIALLVNRCTSEERALARYPAGSAQEIIDAAFFAAVQAFSQILAPSSRRGRTGLISGWMLYEARRRLGEAMVVIDARRGRPGKVWIDSGHVQEVIALVARDLVRGHRKHATTPRLEEAFDALVVMLRKHLPMLAGYGLVHERPQETARLRERLVEGLEHFLAEPLA